MNGQHYLKSNTLNRDSTKKIPRTSVINKPKVQTTPKLNKEKYSPSYKTRPVTAKKPEVTTRAYVPPKAVGARPQTANVYSPAKQASAPKKAETYVPPAPAAPRLPGTLVKLFEKDPQNFPGIVPELSDENAFQAMVTNWKK